LPVFPSFDKWRQLLPTWTAALGLSAALVWAGERWPTPLLEQGWALERPQLPPQLALLLVFVPPALMGLLLIVRMRGHHDRGESSD
jgi:hypothetical protein